MAKALDIALRALKPTPGDIVHSTPGSQFTSWAFIQRLRAASLLLSLRTVGDALDNAIMESCGSVADQVTEIDTPHLD